MLIDTLYVELIKDYQNVNVVYKNNILSKIKYLKNHQGFMKYFKNTSWLCGEKIIRMLVGLFISKGLKMTC